MNISGSSAVALAATAQLCAWAPMPTRTIRLADGSGNPNTSGTAMPILAARQAGSTSDDTVDLTGCVAPGDRLTMVTLMPTDGSITVLWASFQGALASARISGGVVGTIYTFILTWMTLSGAVYSQEIAQEVPQPLVPNSFVPSGLLVGGAGLTPTQVTQIATAAANSTAAAASATTALSTATTAIATISDATSEDDVDFTVVSSPRPITCAFTYVIAGTGSLTMAAGKNRVVINTTSSQIPVYPPIGSGWNGADINVPIYVSSAPNTFSVLSNGSCIATVAL